MSHLQTFLTALVLGTALGTAFGGPAVRWVRAKIGASKIK